MSSVRTKMMYLITQRGVHNNAEVLNSCTNIRNRNPRNLERLRIARKFQGYHLDDNIDPYWHRLYIKPLSHNIKAEVRHFENGPVIEACTSEWALKLYLYRPTDTSAYINLGRVLAQRCLQSGICELQVEPGLIRTKKITFLLEEVAKAGIILEEGERYVHPTPWHYERPDKAWETFE